MGQKNIRKMKIRICLTDVTDSHENCVFCKIVQGKEEGTFVLRKRNVSAFLDIHPLFEGHTLVVPNKHFESIEDVTEEYLSEVMTVAKMVSKLMLDNLKAEGINIMHSTGRPAGQTINHFHVHVLPRKTGDDSEFQRWWFARSHKAERSELEDLVERLTGL